MATTSEDSTSTDRSTTVLVVDDDVPFARACETWLEPGYDVRVATNGATALDALSHEIDVALIDRRLDDMAGRDVLEAIRDADLDCRVAMLTAVEPSADIIEMPFDEYLVKPVTASDVRETVDLLDLRAEYDDDIQDYYAVTAKLAAFEAEYDDHRLDDHDGYQQLTRRAERLHDRTADRLEDVDAFESVFYEVDSQEPGDTGGY